MSRARLLFVALALLCCVGATPIRGGADAPRIVAVGDVHGDYDALVSILQRSGIVDDQNHWKGDAALLVQTGDFLDRGPKSRAVMDLLMNLEKEAAQAKGRVVVLLGNHEVMNLYGDLRYVAPQDYASFADDGSEKRRQDAYRAHQEALRRRGALAGKSAPAAIDGAARWMEQHPPGFVEHREAFGPEGKYGKWLRTKAALFEESGAVFMHGGLSPAVASMKMGQINSRVKNEIEVFDSAVRHLVDWRLALSFYTMEELTAAAQAALEAAGKGNFPLLSEGSAAHRTRVFERFAGIGGWLTIHPDGPLWYRGFAQWSDQEGAHQVARLAKSYGAARFVVGHSVQADGRIRPRFGGRVFLIDTGMLSSYFPGGRPSALEIADGKYTALYTDQQTVLFDSKAPSAAH